MTRNRIVGYDPAVPADQLTANPRNWRHHPARQAKALTAVLDRLGWIGVVIVNRRTGHVIDGHLRAGEAIARDETIPVIYVDLDPDEELTALATYDVLTSLATTDGATLAGIADEVGLDGIIADVVLEAAGVDSRGADDDSDALPEPDNVLTWGYLQWGKRTKVDSTESEITLLDALYQAYAEREGSDHGFVRWLVEGRQEDPS